MLLRKCQWDALLQIEILRCQQKELEQRRTNVAP